MKKITQDRLTCRAMPCLAVWLSSPLKSILASFPAMLVEMGVLFGA